MGPVVSADAADTFRAGGAASAGGVRRVLVINPNTNPAVTALVARACDAFRAPALAFEVVNPPTGPFSIETAPQREQAERAVLALVQARGHERHDAYVTACFDDLALDALRRRVAVPVLGACEAGIHAARAISSRFLVLTTVPQAVPGISLLMHRYGAGDRATVRAAGLGVAQAAAAGPQALERLVDTVRTAVREDGTQAVLLASGGLTGRAQALAQATGLPVVDAVGAAIGRAAARVR